MRFADIGDSERPAYPVQHVLAALLVLGATKIGQHIFKAPAGIAELPPMIKISGLAANVEQAIDRARPSQYFSSRLNDPPIGELCLRLRRVEPVDLAIGEQLAVTERDVDPDIAVVSARFQQQDAMMAGGGQTIREHAAASAGADDDVVERGRMRHHCLRPGPLQAVGLSTDLPRFVLEIKARPSPHDRADFPAPAGAPLPALAPPG